MKTILVKDLREGLVFSEPVYIDEDSLFVPAMAEIRERDINRLTSLGIESVETTGEIVFREIEREIEKEIEKEKEKEKEKEPLSPGIKPIEITTNNVARERIKVTLSPQEPFRTYLDLIELLGDICRRIESGALVDTGFVDDIASLLLKAVREMRNSFIALILCGEVKGYTMAKSLVNSAILSGLIATEMKLPDEKVLHIITGALLHDVGMLRIPKEIVEKKGGLSNAELQRIQSHTLYAYKIVSQELRYPEEVGAIVLQHHERWDGEGYPRRLIGQAIDLGARIVSVADAFEAMVSKKPYRNSMIGYQAMKNLLSDNLRRFDPDVVKALVRTMGIYPIGSFILLNNGAMARVVDVKATAPLRPTIRILINEAGKVFKQDEGKVVDLIAEKRLFIARAVDPKEITGKNV